MNDRGKRILGVFVISGIWGLVLAGAYAIGLGDLASYALAAIVLVIAMAVDNFRPYLHGVALPGGIFYISATALVVAAKIEKGSKSDIAGIMMLVFSCVFLACLVFLIYKIHTDPKTPN
jgi:hypothetical protein